MEKLNPTIKIWNGIKLVKVSDVGEKFAEWLYGQTMPLVVEDDCPTDWAYYWDYQRFVKGLPIID
jgi:hypothetical protein